MENITREIIADLYPLYVPGNASADTRRLVEAYLKEDPEILRRLEQSGRDSLAGPECVSLPPDLELKTLGPAEAAVVRPYVADAICHHV